MNLRNACVASDFLFMKYTKIKPEKLSINEMTQRNPSGKIGDIGPHTSELTISNGDFARSEGLSQDSTHKQMTRILYFHL